MQHTTQSTPATGGNGAAVVLANTIIDNYTTEWERLVAGAPAVPPLPRWAESGEDEWTSSDADGTLFANRECNIGEVGHREPGARDGKVSVALGQDVRCKDGIVTEGPLEVILSGFDSVMVPARSVRALVALLLEAANVIEGATH